MRHPGIDSYIKETSGLIGDGLGEESEMDRTYMADDKPMWFASKQVSPGKYEVKWVSPVEFTGPILSSAMFKAVTVTTEQCERQISIEGFEAGEQIDLVKGPLPASAPSVQQIDLPDPSARIRPILNRFSNERSAFLTFRCVGSKPFKYGADFVSISARYPIVKW